MNGPDTLTVRPNPRKVCRREAHCPRPAVESPVIWSRLIPSLMSGLLAIDLKVMCCTRS